MGCSACGGWPPAGANFCPVCGAPIAAPTQRETAGAVGAVRGELRHVTVVFCDLVDSTRLSTQLDPEDLGDLTARYHEAVVNVVERYGGEVVRYLGDGVLVEFGWPVAHDDDSERAVRAAIEIAAAVEEVDRELPAEIALAARIGVHTGPVLIGEFGAGAHRTTMSLGETMNVAARMQEAAAPGTAVISETTRRLVRGIFVTEELPPQTFKGLPEPLQIHRVVQPSGVPSRFDARPDRLTPHVGRQREVQYLLDVWQRTRSGGGGAVLITGEAGIGKSRLVYELRQAVSNLAHTWLECRCSSYTQHTALRPAIELLERGLGFQPQDDPPARLAKLERALTRTGIDEPDAIGLLSPLLSLPSDGPGPRLTPESQRQRTRELIARWAVTLAQLQPLILLAEDLQWADPSTLALFELLVGQAADVGLLVIGTARPGFRPSWPTSLPIDSLELEPLAEDEIRTLVAGLDEEQALPEALVVRLVADSAGIPLFAEEIGRMLLESDLLVECDGALEPVNAIERLEIPGTLQESLMARLDRVNVAKRVAQYAAVVGRDFDQELIESLTGLPDQVVTDGLAQLVADELVFQHGEGPRATYTFKHALIQEAAYRSLLKRTRRELHAEIAQTLVRRAGRAERDLSHEVIARHYEAAGRRSEAVGRYREAAQQSARRAGYEEAAEHLKRALRLLTPISDSEGDQSGSSERHAELLIALGQAQWNAGRFDSAQEAFRDAAQIALEARLPEQLAHAALGYGGRMAFGAGFRDETLISLLEAALEAVSEDHGALRAQVMARLAEALTFSETRERRAGLCRDAVRGARATGDARALASVLAHQHWALWGPDNLDERVALSREIVAAATRAEDRVLEAEGRLWLVADLMEASQVQAAEREFEDWVTVAQDSRQHYQLWTVAVFRAMRALMSGSIEEAERLATEALAIGQRDGNQNAFQLFGVQLAGIRREQGRYAELEEPLKVFVEQYTAIPTWRCALAFLYADAGREDEARRHLDHLAAGGFASFRKDIFWFPDVVLAADAAALLADRQRSEALYEQLHPYARRCVMCGPIAACWGSTSRTLAVLAATMQRWDEAEHHFEEAVEHNRLLGARLWLTRSQLEYAEMLATRGWPGDLERALSIVDEALGAALALSLADPERKAIALQVTLEATVGDGSPGRLPAQRG
jgi:class 3 adenylate cyclase/tetratricopeptide (TPR) repeat protein